MIPTFRQDLSPTVKKLDYPIKSFERFDALDPDRTLPLNWCTYGYNVTVGDGKVVGSVGISDAQIDGLSLPSAISVGSRIVKAEVFRTGNVNILVALMQNKKLYTAAFGAESFTFSGITFTGTEVTFLKYHYNDTDCLIIIGDDGQMFVYDGQTFTTVADAPHLTCACVFNERVYGTVANDGVNRLYFSDDLDPTNWHVSLTEGGYVDFVDDGGKVTGVIGYKGNLYVFREYAVHRLSAYVDQRDYVMTKVYSGHDRIYFASAQVVDDKLLFLTESGFLYTDGYSVKRIFERVSPLIVNRDKVKSGSFGNKYFLSCGVVKDNNVVGDEGQQGQINNGVFIYDFLMGTETLFRGADVGQFLPVGLNDGYVLLVLFGSLYRGFRVGVIDNSGKLFGRPLKKYWKSPYTDFGMSNVDKVIKRAFVTVSAPVDFFVRTENAKRYALGGSAYSQVLPVRQKGHKVGLELTSEDAFSLSDVTLEIDLVRREVTSLAR